MILIRCKKDGRLFPAVLDKSGLPRDLSGHIRDVDFSSFGDFDRIERIKDIGALPLIGSGYVVGSCVSHIGQILCVGGNYVGSKYFVEERSPRLVFKGTSSIGEPNAEIILPHDFKSTIAEVELGVVIGKQARFVSSSDAIDYIAGYCVVGDFGDYEYGKEVSFYDRWSSLDGFTPLGTRLVTVTDAGFADNLNIWLCVNGEPLQDSSTSNMSMGVCALIEYATKYTTLNPGDLVLTGAPPLLRKESIFLKEGDIVTFGIDLLGEQTHKVTVLEE